MFAGTLPQPELGARKYWGSLHSRDCPGHCTALGLARSDRLV